MGEDKHLLRALLDIVYPGLQAPNFEANPPATVFATQLVVAGTKCNMPDIIAFDRSTISQSCGRKNTAITNATDIEHGKGIWIGSG